MALELRDIHKRFGPVRANDGVSLTVEAGTLHGLLGENGAGKSTLMKVVSGFIEADSGEVRLDGVPVRLASPADAIAAGIGMLHQDPLVFLPFTVLDNFLLASPGKLDRSRGREELLRMGDELGFRFDPDRPARSLTVGERQQLEIARLLWLGAKVLIFDEPTTGISEIQREQLFATLHKLAGDGLIVIFVSHKLEEVEQLCSSVTVMRQGAVVGEVAMPASTEFLVEMMFGRFLAPQERPAAVRGGLALRLDALSVRSGSTGVVDLSLTVEEGEIIGLAGLEGSGQRVFLEVCAGLLPASSGAVTLGGRDLTKASYADHLKAGVHYLPAGRLEEGLVAGMTITEHFALTGSGRSMIDWDEARSVAEARIDDHHIKGVPDSAVEDLSGGNQQRLLLAMLPESIRLLLMEHPTRGLDVESADYVWSRLLQRRTSGTAILFSSADIDELLRYSDRIVVFFSGSVLRVVDAADTDGEDLGYLIGGKERP
jgi:general nucleoside transport system ATP-binding protein